jgi:glycosyltransferase involved in cell wall biosynthesis
MKGHMSYEYSQINDTKCKRKFLEKIKALYYEKYFKNFFDGSNLDLELSNIFPKISVIVPVYNTEKYLHKCLDSIISQTLKDIEIICINDGSTDSSYQILKDYVKKDNRIKIINQKNKGPSEARNKALDMVNSPYVMFVDSDDWIESITLEIFYDKILKENADIVLCNYVSVPEDQLMLTRANEFQKYYDSFRKPTGLYKFNGDLWEYRAGPNCKLYKMDIINKYNFRFPAALINEDETWHWYYFSVIKYVYFINESFYHRLIRKDSIMYRRDIDGVGVLDMIYNLKYIYQYLQKNKLYNKYDKQYIKYFNNCTRNALLRSSSNRKLYKKANREIRKLSKELKFNYFLYVNKHYYKETLNYFFSVYNENTHKVVKIFGLKIKFRKEKILKTRKNITKVFERIFCIKNEGLHKVVGILSIKIKVKRKYKILLETFKYQEKCIKNLQSQVELQNKLLIKALLNQTEDFKNILTEKIEVVDKKIANQSEGFKKVLTENIGVVDKKIANQGQEFKKVLTEKIEVVDEKIANQSEGFKKVLTENIGVVDKKIVSQGQELKKIVSVKEKLNYSQVESFFWLTKKLKIHNSLPPLRNWAMSPDVLLKLHEYIIFSKPKVIVEFGSGVSTIVICDALHQNNSGRLISVEHIEQYAQRTMQFIKRENLQNFVDWRLSELEIYKDEHLCIDEPAQWYCKEALKDIKSIDLLIVDGPPAATCKYARYPALPVFYENLNKQAQIWMDDAAREDENVICKTWTQKYGLSLNFLDFEKGLAILTKK